ncbi:unnamed protein product [Dibothriocephalus latus]|uniref:alanine--tRNA ligase n=1 Tax=Dibothriocephalus latus TaxID=60516 RepID=A0A3P6TGP9_DIBLA|nr:unnamed protein product [Dibothriocephalus latus]
MKAVSFSGQLNRLLSYFYDISEAASADCISPVDLIDNSVFSSQTSASGVNSQPNPKSTERSLALRIFNEELLLWRQYATLPSTSRHPAPGGECTVDHKLPFSRHVKLAPSIKKAICSSNDLRDEFLSFFQDRGHKIVAPSSVYPKRQEGSYFVNAGMNQFKELFLQTHETESEFTRLRRAVDCQPCIRIGGRHDDLNDVGYDTYHHTMFEMLGNWSFGDYGKETACRQMWKFLTEVLGLPAKSLYVTYFGGCPDLDLPADDETRDIWMALGVSDQKLLPFGFEHNFWRADQAAGGGLCGPATEIHVDYRALSGTEDLNCARCLVNAGDPQVVELWNCVFITHRLLQDSSGKNRLLPLPSLNVDTGMGLERLASVMQGVMTTYDTDIYSPLMSFIEAESKRVTGSSPSAYEGHFHCPKPAQEDCTGASSSDAQASPGHLGSIFHSLFSRHKTSDKKKAVIWERQPVFTPLLRDVAYRVLADHSRALALALQDGLLPGRQGVQLKLRHLIYRASRAAILSDLDSPEKPQLLGRLVAEIVRTASSVNQAFDVQGPSARRPPAVTPDQASGIINQELHDFAPRLMKMEAAFQTCLDDMGPGDSLTAVQPLLATLSAIVLPNKPDASASPTIVCDPSLLAQTLSTLTNSADVFGLVFDSTNFFSPSGGQASDTGHIICPTSKKVLFEVQCVERCSREAKESGWVVHWVRPSGNSTASLTTPLQFLLSPDKPDRCYVKLTVLTESTTEEADEDLTFLRDLICRVEERCRAVIAADLPISVKVMPWTETSEVRLSTYSLSSSCLCLFF